MKFRHRQNLLAAVLAATAIGAAAPANAQTTDWAPSKPVTLVVPYNAGGGTDATARAVARQLAVIWKQPVLVENAAGADGLIGTRKVIDANPDGYTLLVQVPSIVLMKYQSSLKGIDPLSRLEPVTSIATSPTALVVGGKQPVRTIDELVRHCKTAQVPCSAGSGENSSKVRARQFAADNHLPELTVVSYRGTSAIINDLVAGNVTMAFTGITAALPLHKTGQLRIIATNGDKRAAALPDIPTSMEAGWPDSYSVTWYGDFAPKKTPPRVLTSIANAIRETGKAPEVQRAIAVAGAAPELNSPAQFSAQVKKDDARFAAMVKRFPLE
jgi:tripartite-type tricarboxylate transporter receptor subunit TctC